MCETDTRFAHPFFFDFILVKQVRILTRYMRIRTFWRRYGVGPFSAAGEVLSGGAGSLGVGGVSSGDSDVIGVSDGKADGVFVAEALG